MCLGARQGKNGTAWSGSHSGKTKDWERRGGFSFAVVAGWQISTIIKCKNTLKVTNLF